MGNDIRRELFGLKKTNHLLTPWSILAECAASRGVSVTDPTGFVASHRIAYDEYTALCGLIKDLFTSELLSFDKLVTDFTFSSLSDISRTDFYSYIKIPSSMWFKNQAGTISPWFRIALLDGRGISERLFGKTPDTICTRNEKLFLHVLSVLSPEQLIQTRDLIRSNANFDDTYIQEAHIDRAKDVYNLKFQVINEFRQKSDMRFQNSKTKTIFPYMLNNDYVMHRQVLGELRIIDASEQALISFQNFYYNNNSWLTALKNSVLAASKKAVASYAAPTILSLSRTLVGIDDLLFPLGFNAPHRNCYCDFDKYNFFVLNPSECRWVEFFRQIHPEKQSEFIAYCIQKFNIRFLPQKVNIASSSRIWESSI